jgi:hypothetical protein
MAKQYRILEIVSKQGTKYETRRWYPQVMDSHTLNAEIEPWEFYDDPKYKDENVWFHGKDTALEFIQERKAEDIPVKTTIHTID